MKRFFCALACPLLVLTAGCAAQPTQTETTRTIAVQTIAADEAADVLTVSGNVTPTDTVKLSFKLSGVIDSVLPKEGDMVAAGEVVARLKTDDYTLARLAADAQTSAAEAQRAAAQAEYDAAVRKVNTELPSKIAQAKAQLELTQATYERVKAVYEAGGASASQLDEITTKLTADRETYQQALDAVDTAEAELAAARRKVDAYAAQAAAYSAQDQKAANDLADTTLTSPLDGVVLSQIMNVGEVTSAGYPVLAVGSIDDIYVEIGVSDTQISRIQKGQEATISVYGVSDALIGTVEEISALADSTTRTFPVRLRVANPEKILRPGMIAQVSLPLSSASAVLVPIDSVIQKTSGSVVFVYDAQSGTVAARTVTTGNITGDRIQVTAGLRAGDALVVQGQYVLHDGDAAVILDEEAAS
ncbi:MAG: efflux RND transporter periplasmic adaptor subunit [Butyricicoccus sp.]